MPWGSPIAFCSPFGVWMTTASYDIKYDLFLNPYLSESKTPTVLPDSTVDRFQSIPVFTAKHSI